MLTHCISADMHETNMHARKKMVVVVKIDFSGQFRRAKPIPIGWGTTRSLPLGIEPKPKTTKIPKNKKTPKSNPKAEVLSGCDKCRYNNPELISVE